MMYQALNGLGSCVGNADEEGNYCVDLRSVDAPTFASTQPNAYPVLSYPTQSVPVSGTPQSGFNWGLLAPLFNAAGTIGAGYAAGQLKPGQSLQTQGATITGQGQALPGSFSSLGSSGSSLMPLMLMGVGALVLVMAMKGKG